MSISIEGWMLLFSQLEILCLVTPSAFARSTCDKFLARRSCLIFSLSVISNSSCESQIFIYYFKLIIDLLKYNSIVIMDEKEPFYTNGGVRSCIINISRFVIFSAP